MIFCMCTISFGVLRMICVLVVDRCTANVVAQLCKIVSRPSKCILTCGHNCKGKGHHVVSRVWTHSVMLGEVET